jgi:hypothetical protein
MVVDMVDCTRMKIVVAFDIEDKIGTLFYLKNIK